MSAEWKIRIKILTSWILKAFLSFVPKMKGCRMGTGQLGDKGRAFPSNFSSNLRIYFFFLFPAYRLPTTDYCVLATAPFSSPISLYLEAILSLSKANLSLPEANLSLPEANLSLRKPNQPHRKPNISLSVNNCSTDSGARLPLRLLR